VRRLALVLVCALALPVSTARAWTWPVDGPVLRPFVFDHDSPYEAGQHRGIDIGTSAAVEVRAPVDGVVSFAGTVPTGGKTLSIETPSGYTATLLHLGSIGVKRGAAVLEGDVVAAAGAEGDAEPYVYFGVRRTNDPQGYVDPLGLLPAAHAPSPSPAVEAPAQSVAAVQPTVATPSAEGSVEVSPQPLTVDAVTASAQIESRPGIAVTSRRVERAIVRQPERQARPTRVGTDPSVERHATTGTASVGMAPRPELREHIRSDADVRGPKVARDAAGTHSAPRNPLPLLIALLAACAFASVIRQGTRQRTARIMFSPEPELSVVRSETEEDPRRTGLAVCVGAASPRPRGRVRGAGGHLRALPPPEGQRRPDGERDGRARHAGDGDGGSRRRLAA
jgi:murein DD-endopeptidase MepM/ murein hydrolase activator NlpD